MSDRFYREKPAFPPTLTYSPGGFQQRGPDGMSLRDYFAGQALAGILADDAAVSTSLLEMFGGPGLSRGDVAASAAYKMADAMIKARAE